MKFVSLLTAAGMIAAAPTTPVSYVVSEDFNLAARVGAAAETSFLFAASTNGTEDQLVLYRPTKDFLAVAYTNSTSEGTALNVRYGGEQWGLSISNFGQGSNRKTIVTASKDYQEFKWFVSDNGQITHKLIQGSEHFLVCSDFVNYLSTVVLSDGTPALNGSDPYGCSSVRVYKQALL
ncbi:uncharacterized protein K489DRAFT_433034 [Dissoconium aciculare CBS 342.82]|uniref:DUF7907 domain-containing protein n=1 Tax=Dissoconium aciculare CBS 342.82 TaxID=1314786 RepID=A0A6J3LZS5_9PEZI|nr:uncharacterized protein K489DRAFT_433034 [Dissoconium aciculare CBS 342.82]KAF1821163.1 hypothetical protein K489DRAFT_433034 [Dissoconium aciculare CBS 342.82]